MIRTIFGQTQSPGVHEPLEACREPGGMSDEPTTRARAAGRPEQIVGDGAVEVTIGFAPMQMSVAELEALRSGGVIELGCNLREARLAVRVADSEIASGRFIVLAEGGAGLLLERVRI